MQAFGELIVHLARLVPERASAPGAALEVQVSALELTLPFESRIEHGGELLASLPRGRLATGFDPPLGNLSLKLVVAGSTNLDQDARGAARPAVRPQGGEARRAPLDEGNRQVPSKGVAE
jgi:hypothetical protein